MSEHDAQRHALIDTSEALTLRYADRDDVYVSANMFIYYEMNNPQRNVSPDVFVVFGVEDHWRGSYFVWREGKAPDFVLEIASPGTYRRDAGEKRGIYANMGVGEYWRFDPYHGRFMWPSLVGERLAARGRYTPVPVAQDATGGLRAHSRVLGLDLCVVSGALKLYDPVTGLWLRNLREENAARRVAEEQAEAAQERAEAEAARAASEAARAQSEAARADLAEATSAKAGTDAPGARHHAAQWRLGASVLLPPALPGQFDDVVRVPV